MKNTETQPRPSQQQMVRRRTCELYVTEKIEAYNVAIEALRGHEPADGDPSGIARKLRRALADKLDREIQKWCDANPPNAPGERPALEAPDQRSQ